MQKIKLLSEKEILKIAAGQVVDRPANVVKELVENSIDAGAKKVTVHIKDGGKELIRVVDNGCGMSAEDAKFCFAKHSTSKIMSLDELCQSNGASTFGFRGEALASISAVSRVSLATKEAESINGVMLELENGEFVSEISAPLDQGTDLKIKNLFYNTPARQKFLKKRESENRNIVQLMQSFCLDYIDVDFKLYLDDKQVINCPQTDCIVKRAAQLWDHNFAKNLIKLQDLHQAGVVDEKYKIYGAVTNHQYYRYDRGNIFLFVNKRWIRNQEIQSALLKGYINVLPAARYPAAFIFIEIDPAEVDVNYHPRKEEVKILHPRIITNKLQEMVRIALQNNLSSQLNRNVSFKSENIDQSIGGQKFFGENNFSHKDFEYKSFDQMSFEANKKSSLSQPINYEFDMKSDSDMYFRNYNNENNFIDDVSLKEGQVKKDYWQASKILDSDSIVKESDFIVIQSESSSSDKNTFTSDFKSEVFDNSLSQDVISNDNLGQDISEKVLNKEEYLAGEQLELNINTRDYSIIGQFNKTYILIEKEDGIFFVDQHVAHERVLYQRFSKRFEDLATIKLLFPILISLKQDDIELLESNLSVFIENGIEIEIFGETQIKVQATPVHAKNIDIKELVQEVVSWIREFNYLDKNELFKKINDNLQSQMACKAAIKAGDVLSYEQMDKLLLDLEKTENCFACPHGRPTGWLLTIDEIEKRFRRKL